jgi:hypothetical protein
MKKRAVQVWVDVDEGIADLVIRLNSIPGVRTRRSCQGVPHGTDGTFCHGSFHHGPYVVVKCADAETLQNLRGEFDVEAGWVHAPNGEPVGDEWPPNLGIVRPKSGRGIKA